MKKLSEIFKRAAEAVIFPSGWTQKTTDSYHGKDKEVVLTTLKSPFASSYAYVCRENGQEVSAGKGIGFFSDVRKKGVSAFEGLTSKKPLSTDPFKATRIYEEITGKKISKPSNGT